MPTARAPGEPERKPGPAGTRAGDKTQGVKRLPELVGETGGLGWVAVKAVLLFAVARVFTGERG